MKYIYIFLISMLPLIEIRGALPYAQILNLNLPLSVFLAIIGNLIPIPFVYFFAHKILVYMQESKYFGKFSKFVLAKGHKAGIKIVNKSHNGIFLALLLFVAIPLPGTGAYTAILAASILELDFKKSFVSIALGVFIAGIIVFLFTNSIKYLFLL